MIPFNETTLPFDRVVFYKSSVAWASTGTETLSEDAMIFAEVDGNEGLSYNDALKILRVSIGLDTLD